MGFRLFFLFLKRLGTADPRSHALIGAEVTIVLVAATVLGTGRLDALCASQTLLTPNTEGDNQGFTPMLEIGLRLGDLLCLDLLYALRPELEEDLDDIGSPVLRLLTRLLNGVGAGELVTEPRSQ